MLKIAENNPNTVAEWMGKAQYTLGVNAGYLPPLYRDEQSQSAAATPAVRHRPTGFEYSRPAEGAVYPQQQSALQPERQQRRWASR